MVEEIIFLSSFLKESGSADDRNYVRK